MQKKPFYRNLMAEIHEFLNEALERAVKAGISRDLTVVDPGIGFGKTFDHNLQIIRDLGRLQSLGRPILLGSSSKGFIGQMLGRRPHERDTGTMATLACGVLDGAHIMRVHNVAMALETVKVVDAIIRGRMETEG